MPDQATPKPAFDADGFYESLDNERKSRGLNWKDVAKEAAVSASTLTRLGQGRRPDVDSFSKLCGWGGLDPEQFLTARRRQQEGGFLTNLPTYLRADPNLNDRSVEALEAIIGTAYEQFRSRD